MKKSLCLFTVFIVFFVCTEAFPSPADSLKKIKAGFLPSLFYTPETRLGAGGLVYTFFKFSPSDSLLRKSTTQSYVTVTLNKQFALENDFQLWFNKNIYLVSGQADCSRFPQFFYGTGNKTDEHHRIMISFDLIKIQTKALIRFNKSIYGGITVHYHRVFHQDEQLKSWGSASELHGNNGFEAKGIGPVLVIDKRDNTLNPAKGIYFELSYTDYQNLIRNTHMFTSFLLDARKYHTFFKRIIWNANLYLQLSEGQVPYGLMPSIGGARFLRGYYKGRFRDNHLLVFQQEFRVPIYKMAGFALFGGIGEVAHTLKQLKTNELHYNYGMGLRIRINKKENANLRIDYGITKDSHGLYIVFAEAF